MAHVLVSPTSTFSSVRFHGRSRHQAPLPRRSDLKISSSTHYRRLAVARASTQPAPGTDNNDPQSTSGPVPAPAPAPAPTPAPDPLLGSLFFSPTIIPPWAKTMLKTLVLVAFPFYKSMMRVEAAVEEDTVTAVEIVEHTAHLAEMIAEGVEGRFAEGSVARQKIVQIQQFAMEVETKAENLEVVIKKVDKIIQRADTFLEPLMIEGEDLQRQIDPKSMCPFEHPNAGQPQADPSKDPPKEADPNKDPTKEDLPQGSPSQGLLQEDQSKDQPNAS